MTALLALHTLAAQRGDGLHPALRALMETRVLVAAGTIAELAQLGPNPHIQAGPHPASAVTGELPQGVHRFARESQSSPATPMRAAKS